MSCKIAPFVGLALYYIFEAMISVFQSVFLLAQFLGATDPDKSRRITPRRKLWVGDKG